MTDHPPALVTVPVDPTGAMIEAAESAGMSMAGSDMSSHDMTRHVWSAMLTAAPVREEGGAVQWGWRVRAKPSKTPSHRTWHWQADEPTETTAELCEWEPVYVSLATREEAPAEGAGEAIRAACIAWHEAIGQNPFNVLYRGAWCGSFPHQTGPERWTFTVAAMEKAIDAYLRARSSAPEAREDAQPVAKVVSAHGDPEAFGEREIEVLQDLKRVPHNTPLYTHPAPDALRVAVTDIAAERQRQVDVEGWSEAHDDEHDGYQMARAAGCYAFHASREDDDGDTGMFVSAAVHHGWPWDRAWWKPKSRRADLVRAGALIVAEIERLDRAALQAEQKGGA